MRRICAVAVMASLLMSSGFASAEAPLPSGKPAGVNKAALLAGPGFMIALGIGFTALSVGLIAGGNNGNKQVTTNTTSTLP